jgi:hypothetical protein
MAGEQSVAPVLVWSEVMAIILYRRNCSFSSLGGENRIEVDEAVTGSSIEVALPAYVFELSASVAVKLAPLPPRIALLDLRFSGWVATPGGSGSGKDAAHSGENRFCSHVVIQYCLPTSLLRTRPRVQHEI